MAQDSLSVAGKVAIITGSGKETGIGAAIAWNLARAGAKVTLNYVSESTAERAATVTQKINEDVGQGTAIVVQADSGTPEGNQKLVDETLAKFGVDHIDILVNNAAWTMPATAVEAKHDDLEKAFRVNVFGPIYLIQTAMPYMSKGGRIINIGSVASKLGIAGLASYVGSKAAMDALTLSMAKELGREGKGITINTVAPGPVGTDMMIPGNPVSDGLSNFLLPLTRLDNRYGTTSEIADAVLFLASEKSRWITGQFISVSGGITGN